MKPWQRRVLVICGGAASSLLLGLGISGLLMLFLISAGRNDNDPVQIEYAVTNCLLSLLSIPIGWMVLRAGGVPAPLKRTVIALLVFVPAALIVNGVGIAFAYPLRADYPLSLVINSSLRAVTAGLGGLALLWQSERRAGTDEQRPMPPSTST